MTGLIMITDYGRSPTHSSSGSLYSVVHDEWESYTGFRLACRSPLCRCVAWSSLGVKELQLSAATLLWLYHRVASLPSWIEFNCLRSAAVGKAARLSIYWQDAACRLVIPLRQVALVQLYKYHHQSGKLVWKQHYTLITVKVLVPSVHHIYKGIKCTTQPCIIHFIPLYMINGWEP